MGVPTTTTATHPPRRAFSLVELMVVMGIIGLLTGILLPAAGKAREQARRVACLSNVRQIAQATLQYMGDNRQYLPDACSTNAPLETPVCPRTVGLPPGSPIPDSAGMFVMTSIGGLLETYLARAAGVWRCPSAPDESYALTGDDPFRGTKPPDEFKPNYSYMAGKEIYEAAAPGGPIADQFKLRAWATRNVSGLRANRAVPQRQTQSEVVLFHDRDSTYHSRGRKSIYTTPGPWDYYASYAFLDGRVEGRSYRDADGYVRQLHRAIPQQWFGRNFPDVFPEQYAP